MPADRFLHPRLGYSVKVSSLDDLAFRVWTQYLLSADDFGVMPQAASVVRGANLALQHRSEDEIEKALETVVGVKLVLPFTDQGLVFVCDPLWQDFQKIRYPRQTSLPCPPAEILRVCSRETAALFRSFHERFPKDFRLSRARAGANGYGSGKRLPREEGTGEKPASRSDLREQAVGILGFLNERAGLSFRPVEANLRFIEARLRDGATVDNCRGVIVRKVREWKGDPKMHKYLRPETLFNATKFESYLGERAPDAS